MDVIQQHQKIPGTARHGRRGRKEREYGAVREHIFHNRKVTLTRTMTPWLGQSHKCVSILQAAATGKLHQQTLGCATKPW